MPPRLIHHADMPIAPSRLAADARLAAESPSPLAYLGYLPTREEPHRTAFLENAASIRDWIYRDATRKPEELQPLLGLVAWKLGDPSLTAASARQMMQIDDPQILRRFRRAAGASLTEYIQRRKMELAARMTYRSDLPLEDVAGLLGFASEKALTRAVEVWARGCPLESLRELWEDRGVDTVVWMRIFGKEAADHEVGQFLRDLARLYPGVVELYREPLQERGYPG